MKHPLRDRIERELSSLNNQKKQYLVAIAVAEVSRTLRRHIRTVQRLEDEIAARREVLSALPALPTEFTQIAQGPPPPPEGLDAPLAKAV